MLEEQTLLSESSTSVPSSRDGMGWPISGSAELVPPPLPPCIQWVSSGKAFVITSMPSFTSCVLPHYFKTTKFSSFQRNLNLYGFSKVIRGADRGSYFNPNFARGDEANLRAVKRVKRPRKKAQFEIGGGGWEEGNDQGGGAKKKEGGTIDALALLAKACAAGD